MRPTGNLKDRSIANLDSGILKRYEKIIDDASLSSQLEQDIILFNNCVGDIVEKVLLNYNYLYKNSKSKEKLSDVNISKQLTFNKNIKKNFKDICVFVKMDMSKMLNSIMLNKIIEFTNNDRGKNINILTSSKNQILTYADSAIKTKEAIKEMISEEKRNERLQKIMDKLNKLDLGSEEECNESIKRLKEESCWKLKDDDIPALTKQLNDTGGNK